MSSRFSIKNERVLKVLADLGIDEPTEAQRLAIPEILDGKNTLVIAPTGIGKTEAAMLPILDEIEHSKPKGIACLYITPLRALNRDMMKRLVEFGKRLEITIGVRHGDTPQSERMKQSRSPPQILITTPETFQILFLGPRLRTYLKHVKWVVVDEIHELAEDERGAQLAVGLERLVNFAGEYQRIGLSATVGDHDIIAGFLGGGRRISVVKVATQKSIDLAVESPQPKDSDEELATKLHTDKKHLACMKRAKDLIEKHRSTLFFVNTRDTAEALGVRYRLWDDSFRIGVHHGSLSKEIRVQMEEEFKGEALKALICTSSLELGIDIGSADFTIQFNSPRQVTRIIQRVGRSGHRVGGSSVGRILATDFMEMLEGAVICRKAMKGELERMTIRKNPLAVLSNQVAAMVMTAGSIGRDEVFSTVKRSYPYLDLARADFDRVVEAMRDLRTVAQEGTNLRKSARTMKYFYDNISMIPDEKTFRIREISSRRIIGTLDESFVAASLEPYSTFVARGRTWQVVEVREDEVLVEEVREIAATPSWVGEEIPVPFAVAQEVADLRAHGNLDDYPVHADVKKEYSDFAEAQREKKSCFASGRTLLIEKGDRLLVIHAAFGTKVNQTLSRLVGSLLAARLGESLAIDSNAYSIVLKTPMSIPPSDIEKMLIETKPEALEPLLRMILRSSSSLRWQFLHIAKKFGAVEKGADFRTINLSRIMEVFEDSVLFDEAVDRTMHEELDVGQTAEVLRMIQSREIVIETGRLSPMGERMIGEQKKLMYPKTADKVILTALKNRLLEEEIVLYCLNCRSQRRTQVKNLPSRIKCPVCDGLMIAAVRPYVKEDMDAVSRKGGRMDAAIQKRLYKTANLVKEEGKRAVMALVARGVGPDTAARLLHRVCRNEDEFLRDVLAAEVLYARTKRFWD